jgi:hypothetical protein
MFMYGYSYLLQTQSPKLLIMKLKRLFTAGLLAFPLFLVSCGGKDKKADEKTSTEITKPVTGTDIIVPAIDTAALKDEASILDAMQKVADARIADEKKQKEDPNYSGHYLELTKLYTAVLKASTAYSKTIPDAARAVEFGNKLSAVQDKMYAK